MSTDNSANDSSRRSEPSRQQQKPPRNSDSHPQQRHRPPKARDTHFLCLPLVSETSIPQLITSLAHFRQVTTRSQDDDDSHDSNDNANHNDSDNEIRSSTKSQEATPSSSPSTTSPLRIIPSTAHRPPGTFHLTLGVMDLSNPSTMKRATDLLQSIDYRAILNDMVASTATSTATMSKPTTLNSGSNTTADTKQKDNNNDKDISITLSGLSTFPPTALNSARVLYAKPIDTTISGSSDMLHPFSISIRQRFRAAGLITESRPLVLHATVVNMRYANKIANAGNSSQEGQGKGKRGGRGKDGSEGTIDASGIIEAFNQKGGVVNPQGQEGTEDGGGGGEYIWARNIKVDRVAICKLGAVASDKEGWGLEYPPVVEVMI